MVTLLLMDSRPVPMTLFPLIRLSGHSRNQETKWSSVSHLLVSHPTSPRIVVAVMTSMLPIRAYPGYLVDRQPRARIAIGRPTMTAFTSQVEVVGFLAVYLLQYQRRTTSLSRNW
jgi:hypothetical protein